MYLKKLAIKNYGPINEINIRFPFNKKGNPKPIIFVGKNGTGKTILLSHIIDSFYEIAGNIFDDIKLYEGLKTKFFKINGSINLQLGKDKGFAILQYEIDSANKVEYLDRVGNVKIDDFKKYIKDFNLLTSINKENEKKVSISNKERLEKFFLDGVYFYQPAYRYEAPFWKNDDFKHNIQFKDKRRFSSQLGKELEIINSLEENKDFLLNLVLDFIAGLDKKSLTVWNNINTILRAIKRREDIRFGIGPRGKYRVSIAHIPDKRILLPSIDYFSLGEIVLLDLFLNIIRYSCLYTSKSLQEIKGIVAVDEVDVHLHSNLKYEVLPRLIKLFPKVQFILTTHSPLFLLGMKNVFGENGFEIRNMPNGEIISVERFTEFENAFNSFKETEKFEEVVEKRIEKVNKPILYVEDEYYQIYQIAYLKLNGIDFKKEDLEQTFKKKTPFEIISGYGAGGVAGLLRVKSCEIFKDKKIFGLFDFDTEGREQFYNLSSKEKFWPKKVSGNIKTGVYKKRNDCKNMYAILLPIPERLEQFASLEWGNFASYVEIENLLPENFLKENNFVEEKKAPGDLVYYKCKKDVKDKLWKKTINLDKRYFVDFIPIFKFIEEHLVN